MKSMLSLDVPPAPTWGGLTILTTSRKLLNVSKATALGWTYKTELEDGLRLSYQDFLNNPMRAER